MPPFPIATLPVEPSVKQTRLLRNRVRVAFAHTHQVSFDERVDRAVEHRRGVANLDAGAMVLDHLIRLQHVGSDLAAPRDVFFVLAELLEFRALFALFEFEQTRAQVIFIAIARFLCCERSFWQVTTMPLGIWVKRTAESVLLTCWPPALLAR